MIDVKWIYGAMGLSFVLIVLLAVFPAQYEIVSSAIESAGGVIVVIFMMIACPALAAHGAKTALLPKHKHDRQNGLVQLVFFAVPGIFLWWGFLPKILACL